MRRKVQITTARVVKLIQGLLEFSFCSDVDVVNAVIGKAKYASDNSTFTPPSFIFKIERFNYV